MNNLETLEVLAAVVLTIVGIYYTLGIIARVHGMWQVRNFKSGAMDLVKKALAAETEKPEKPKPKRKTKSDDTDLRAALDKFLEEHGDE